MNKIVSTPQKKRISPNFRMTEQQKTVLKAFALARGEYIQDYMDLVFENLHRIDEMLYVKPSTGDDVHIMLENELQEKHNQHLK